MKRFEVKAICTMVFPDIFANNKHDAIQEVINKLPTNVEKDGVLKCAVIVDDVQAEHYDLMDASNGHDKDLVMQINHAWDVAEEPFCDIVHFLVQRDMDEWEERVQDIPANKLTRREMCYQYCQNVADDVDLQVILNYCRV